MAVLNEMESAAILEREFGGDSLWVWAYPSMKEDQRTYVEEKIASVFEVGETTNFVFCQWKQRWYYLSRSPVEGDDSLHKRVKDVILTIVARDFNPEKYEALCDVFSRSYRQTGSPATLLRSYLSMYTRGECPSDDNGLLMSRNYPQSDAFSAGNINGLINLLGVEFIIVYTAVLLKKRIAIYHSSISTLLNFIRTIPSLAWHRQNWSLLYPHIDVNGQEVDEIGNCTSYVAGFTQIDIESRDDIYDVFVNLPGAEITIAQHAKDIFTMGKLHRDMASFIVQCGEKGADTTIQDIAAKTQDLLNNLNALSTEDENGENSIRLEDLKSRKMATSTENFLYRLAVCEGLVRL